MTPRTILIFDRNRDLADRYEAWLAPEGFEVESTSSQEAALNAANETGFDLALVKLSIPDMDGVGVLTSLREQGFQIPALILSEQGVLPVKTVAEIVALDTAGVIEGPWEPGVLVKSVQRALKEIPTGIIYGDLSTLSLPGLVSTICNEGRQVSLRVKHAGEQITIYFERGDIVHAAWNGFEGKEAVFQALAWGSGQFEIVAGETSSEQTIYTSWSGLMLEGLQRIDETAFDQEQLALDEPAIPDDEPFPGIIDDLEIPAAPSAHRAPSFDLDSDSKAEVENRLARLYQSLRPRCVLLADHSGRLLYLQGDIERSQALSLAALVAGSFSATREIAEIVAREDEHRQFQQSLQEGVDFSLYSAEAGPKWILAVAFRPDETILGLARQFTLQAAADLAAISAQRDAAPEETQEVAEAMDDFFRQGVGDALEDLFG